MTIQLKFDGKKYQADLAAPLDISLPIHHGQTNPNCYWAEPVQFETIVAGDFIGSVKAGGSVNYQKLIITPHGNGTHTECYGHIAADDSATINHCLQCYHAIAELVTVQPVELDDHDQVVTLAQLQELLSYAGAEAIIIRTLPNDASKKTRQYSGTNPPYIQAEALDYLRSLGILHILVDLPSLDKEVDEGKLAGHKAFWHFPHNTRKNCTVTELIYVDDVLPDGLYLLNLQIISLEMDASPSKPVLYKLEEV